MATVQQLLVSRTVQVISNKHIENSILELFFESEERDVDSVEVVKDYDHSFLVSFAHEKCKH